MKRIYFLLLLILLLPALAFGDSIMGGGGGGSSSSFTITGSGLTAGRAYYINSSAALTAADATSAITLPSPALCVATSATVCTKIGQWTTTGLTAGSVYYIPVATGGGALTTTAPSTSGNQVQIAGIASSTTVLEIIVSPVIVEVK